MAAAKKPRPGFEPAKGFPDPESPRTPSLSGMVTHMPHTNGTVCGRKETKAASYTTEAPTCAKCLAYYRAVHRKDAPAQDAPKGA